MRTFLGTLLLLVTSVGYAHTGHHHHHRHHHHRHHHHAYHYHLSAATPAYYKCDGCMYPYGYVPGDFDPHHHHRGFNNFHHHEGQANLRVEYYCR